jgi:hypothetical protein
MVWWLAVWRFLSFRKNLSTRCGVLLLGFVILEEPVHVAERSTVYSTFVILEEPVHVAERSTVYSTFVILEESPQVWLFD